jgi:hypothetical protein
MTTLTTPIYQLPYPDGDELVSDADSAFQSLALAIEAALNPPWTSLTPLGTNYSARAGYFAPGYRVSGGRVQLRGAMTKSAAIVTGDTLFTLPPAACPTATVALPVTVSRASTANSPAGKINIATSGVVTVEVIDTQAPTSLMLDGVSFSMS